MANDWLEQPSRRGAHDGFARYYAERLWDWIPDIYRHEDGLAETPGTLRAIVEKDSLACLGINTEVPASPTAREPDELDTPVVEVIRVTEPSPGPEMT